MTSDPLDRLRAADPVAHGSSAPPLEEIRRRIAELSPPRDPVPLPQPARARRWTGRIVPVAGVAITIAVVAVALVLLRGHTSSPTGHPSPATSTPSTSPGPRAPTGGMGGQVEEGELGVSSAARAIVSVQQCLSCHDGRGPERDWLASTADAGRSWHVRPAPWYLFAPRFDAGGDGWSYGMSGAGIYVSHDFGRTWRTAPSPSPATDISSVSIAAGEVWTSGERCAGANPMLPTGHRCQVTILHARASANRLTATAAQPVRGDAIELEVVAAGPGTAYLSNPNDPQQSFVTRNDGRSWERFTAPCARGQGTSGLAAAGSTVLWDTCAHGITTSTLRRSTDGGRHWSTEPAGLPYLNGITAVSAQVAWGTTPGGNIVRITDGGRVASTVWTLAGSQPAALRGGAPGLTAQGARAAQVLVFMSRTRVLSSTRYTNLVEYRTTDGGAIWRPTVIHLPPG